ncbi:MAG TPA: peptide chain release factor N(5)-glutamine methyltransferase [Steroidobacteraceae bacterium]|nr:peptide chain release factor N(5)-glutamine methyltransferase [Steroidobacteraceae bacterium]
MNPRTLTVSAALSACSRESRRDAELLLAHCLAMSRGELLARIDSPVPEPVALAFGQLLARLEAGEPLAYLTGEKEFWSLPLKVDASVLVPRPETEALVEAALAAGPADRQLAVLDLGTGSGAIALALARERPGWQVTATDLSAAALTVARQNALRLGLDRIEFMLGDWFGPLGVRRFDLIASNPPYVAAGDAALAAAALSHEPRAALVPGPRGLEALEVIIREAPSHLRSDGHLLLEHGAEQGASARKLFASAGFSNIRTLNDLAGHERVTAGQNIRAIT